MTSPAPSAAPQQAIILVTGPSGAGRSTAINALEDIGFETIDNLPLILLPRLLEGPPLSRPLALGLDLRNRDFSVDGVLAAKAAIARDPAFSVAMLYLDCRLDVLMRRYSETRRPHPLAGAAPPREALEREIGLLVPLRAEAEFLVDTSELTPHELRDTLRSQFDTGRAGGMGVSLHSFSYKRGLPGGMDCVFDVRFLANPHWQAELRQRDGRDADVAAYIQADPAFAEFHDRLAGLIDFLLPAYRDEGKSHLAIGIGCTGGQHRSVTVAEMLARRVAKAGWQVSTRHRELERRGLLGAAGKTGIQP